MESYGFTVMLGEPTWMVQLTELAEAQGRAYPLKLIIGSGEMLTERAREWVEKTWSADFLMAYASVDAGTYIGIECYKKQGYHINDAELWVEIVDSGNVHQGRMMGYGRCKIVDADNPDRVIAFNEGKGAIIGVPPEGLGKMDVSGTELVIEDSPDLPPMWQAFGASRRPDGHWQLPALSVELASPDAALHIGPQHVVLETAAIDLAADAVGTRKLQVVSWHVMFMSRGKVGPFRVDGTAHVGGSGKVGVRMLLHDEGNADKAVTSAAAIFEITERE